MSETDILEAGAVASEATDTKVRGHLPERCYACAAPVRGPYCYACGQRNDDCRRSIMALIGESIRDVASFEGRFLRTARAVILRPGRHLREYGRGVRSPYSPPIRFFLVISFLFFTTLWLSGRQIVAFQPEVEVNENGTLDMKQWSGGFFVQPRDVTYSAEERELMLGAVRDGDATPAVAAEVLRAQAADDISAIEAEMREAIAEARAEGDGPDVEDTIDQIEADAQVEIADVRAALIEALAEVSPGDAVRETGALVRDELVAEGVVPPRIGSTGSEAGADAGRRAGVGVAVENGEDGGSATVFKLNGRDVDGDRLRDALFRFAENPRVFNNTFAEWIPRIMILMIPLMTLLGAVVVRGRDALLYDHALLSLNTHAVAFGLMTVGLWTAGFLPGWIFAVAVFLGTPFYYYRAMRGAFGRSRRKTLFATFFVFNLYGFVFVGALIFAAADSFSEML